MTAGRLVTARLQPGRDLTQALGRNHADVVGELLLHVHRRATARKVSSARIGRRVAAAREELTVIDAIAHEKDLDGIHIIKAGQLAARGTGIIPCTPLGCLPLLREDVGDLEGHRAVVIGRSNIVGKPLSRLLLNERCTMTVAHSRTRDLAGECRRADILVAAVGQLHMIKGDWIRRGATILDVDFNRLSLSASDERRERLVGDVDCEAAAKIAGAITPVPGGVGPITTLCLLRNTVAAACAQRGVDPGSLDEVV